MNFQVVESKRLYRQIADQIQGLIESGQLQPGSKLAAERELATQLGVSRPSVREALIALEVKGWVEIRMGTGVFVAKTGQATRLSPDEQSQSRIAEPPNWGPIELLAARGAIEGEIAFSAAIRRTSRQLADIQTAILNHQKALGTRVDFATIDAQFHKSIAVATGNEVFEDIVAAFMSVGRSPFYERISSHFEDLKSWTLAYHEHEQIFIAITRQDGPEARDAMHRHLESATKRLSACLAAPFGPSSGSFPSGSMEL